jgi:hypothetical protein
VPSSELDRPFFARQRNVRLITEIANFQNLCVFAGAGVTVDRTELTWERLMTHLYVRSRMGALPAQSLKDAADAEELIEHMKSPELGSVVVERYRQGRDRDSVKPAIASDLRNILYQAEDEFGGRFSREIAELWIRYREDREDVNIITTTYDQHIELSIKTVLRNLQKQFAAAGEQAPESVEKLSAVRKPVEYIHGRVTKEGLIREPYPVISEEDFYMTGPKAQRALDRAFGGRNVLLVGSGLADPPLLRALFKTRKDFEEGTSKRIAIVPRKDIDALDDSASSVMKIDAFEARLRHFGLEGIYVDYYSQGPQLLLEARLASGSSADRYQDGLNYSARLDSWWDSWFAKIKSQGIANVQSDHHRRLAQSVKDFKSAMRAQDEDLRIELWVRWQPRERHLRLWASSFAQYEDWQLARSEPIRDGSGFVSVQAFCEGRAVWRYFGETQERWKYFIAVPVDSRNSNLVVGSLVIASMKASNSCLDSSRRAQQAGPLGIVLKKCRSFLSAA